MAWYLRNENYREGIYIASGTLFKADDTMRLVPQPEEGGADHKQCGLIPELFGWREEPKQEAPTAAPQPVAPAPQDEKPALPAAIVPEKVKRKVSKLIGG